MVLENFLHVHRSSMLSMVHSEDNNGAGKLYACDEKFNVVNGA